MPEPKRPLKVFLCHASADKPAVRSLYKRLVADGVDVWLDAESLVAGQNWQVEIPQAIRESDLVIVCLSEKAVNKEGYVQKEIKFALDVVDEKPVGTIYIIPVRLESCNIPRHLSVYHWVDIFETDGYTRLMRALSARAERLHDVIHLPKTKLLNHLSDKDLKRIEKLEFELMDLEHDLLVATVGGKYKENLEKFIAISKAKLSELQGIVTDTRLRITKFKSEIF